jgi:predicted permease
MSLFRNFATGLRSLFRKNQVDRELNEELGVYLEMEAAEKMKQGMSRKDALREVRLERGGLEVTKEIVRSGGWESFVESCWQDLRYGLRGLCKNLGVTTIVVLTLALGVGANTAIFGLVNGILLQRLPVSQPEQIVALVVQSSGSALGALGFSYPQLVEFRQQAASFCEVFGQALGRVNLTVDAHTDLVAVSGVSSNYFSTLGLRPALGRLILADEPEGPGAPAVVVLGYTFWQKRFGGDPAVIGKQVRIDGRPAIITGVVPKDFRGQFAGFELDAYLPLSTYFADASSTGFWTNRNQHVMLSLGRLKTGVTIAQAQGRFDVISQRLAAQYPASDKGIRVRVMDERLARPIPYANSAFIMFSAVFLVLGALVLLLACTNIANILMARASVRQREMAVRAALGAARSRLVRQMLSETLLASTLGGVAGVTLGAWLTHLLRAVRLSGFPMRLDFGFDWRVFAYALLAVLFTALLAGLSPALRATRADVNVVFHQGGRPDATGGARHKVRGDLMAAQVAGSFALLIVAGLFVRSLQAVQRLDLGFDPNQLLNVSLDPSLSNYDHTQTTNFYRTLEARIRALPGVQCASLAASVPIAYSEGNHSVFIEGQPVGPRQQASVVMSNIVDSAYFETLRIPILSGRAFTDADDESSQRVAIVNETLARRFWPGQNPIGKRFSLVSNAGPFVEIVGVARDGKYRNVTEDPQPYFYLPLAQNFLFERVLQVRSVLAPEALMRLVQQEILALDASSVIVGIQPMKQSLNGALGYFMFRLGASLAACMGLLGLLLAVVGVYGVVSYAATQRTQELGIRMALGASPRQILSLLLNQGARLVAAGLLSGLAGAWALTRAMAHMLVGVSPSDPLTYLSVAALLSFITLLACWIPARRAMRVDPMVALRYE